MKIFTLFALLSILIPCKKETGPPSLRFSNDEKQWLIYHAGQEYKFKNEAGDSIVYTVTNIEHRSNTPEYKDTSFKIVAYTESYLAKLASSNDSIIIYFYKEWQFNTEPNKLKQTIRWLKVKNQFVKLAAIENNASFTTRTVNGKTYSKVTQAIPDHDTVYPFTQFDKGYYDQQSGFIEIIDLNGVSWKRV